MALHHVLSKLPVDFAVPILIVQHMSDGFTDGFVQWLNDNVDIAVKTARSLDRLEAGNIYLAPENRHLAVTKIGRIELLDTPPVDGFKPSANAMFHSVANAYGDKVLGVVMTGMGRDGADGLISVRESNGTVIGQNEESCVVYGMPRAAFTAGVTDAMESLDGIANHLLRLHSLKRG